ncbi:hypothetical protein ACQP2F_24475 [Actinoplanes sp. CA-030573]|uniref:hypothetical protein n=1 Tax=Actinoplanes sp. CA-030573 TaxID=3239898 RepID=UPI003D8C2737
MRRLLTLGLVIGALSAGCSGGGGGGDLPAMPQKTIKDQVQLYAGITLAASGVATFTRSATNVTGCPQGHGRLSDPDETFYVQGLYLLTVPDGQEAATLAKVGDEWRRDGYTVGSPATAAAGLHATTPDHYTLDLAPDLRLSIASQCFRTG